jgi:predicted dehydrogenase
MGKLKVGIIGVGSICRRMHIPAFQSLPDVEIVAVCDINPAVAQAAADEFKIPHVFTDYNDLLNMDEIVAVDICTPNDQHCVNSIAALNAGKHVLVEKPISRNALEAQNVLDAANKSGRKLQVGQCMRFRADAQTLKRFIDAGDMGEIYYARVQALRRRGIPGHGQFTQKERQGGGPLIDIGVHILDLTLWLMGHPKPVAVSGMTCTKFGNRSGLVGLRGSWDPKNFSVEDFGAGFVRFENGACLLIETSFAANIEKDFMNTALMGTEGGCELSPLKIFREEHQTLVDVTPVFVPTVNMFELQIASFINAIGNDTEPAVTGEQALMTTKIIDAIYESSEKGKEVEI